MFPSILCTIKLLVMLLTFQHLLLLGVLSFNDGATPLASIPRPCGVNMTQLDIQDSKN
jgi:hypothetical protein